MLYLSSNSPVFPLEYQSLRGLVAKKTAIRITDYAGSQEGPKLVGNEGPISY